MSTDVFERDLLLVGVLERQAQQIAELFEHQPRLAGRALHVSRDRIQCVEQEVRIELRAEHGQACFRQQSLEPGGADLAIPQIALIVEGHANHRNRPVDECSLPVGHLRDRVDQRRAQPGWCLWRARENHGRVVEIGVGHGKDDAQRDVEQQPLQQRIRRDGKLAIDPVDGHGQEAPHIPLGGGGLERVEPRERHPLIRSDPDLSAGGIGQNDQRPEAAHQEPPRRRTTHRQGHRFALLRPGCGDGRERGGNRALHG